MTLISNILYWISTGLLVPVMMLLIFFFLRALLLLFSFFGQYLASRRALADFDSRVSSLTPHSLPTFVDSLPDKSTYPAMTYAKLITDNIGNPSKITLLLAEYEIKADKDIASSRILTKIGPILGLMGTLIPMGPALVGLSTGDIASMAYNMQVAFATTVIGLVVSAIGFITQQIKERRSLRFLTLLEYLASIASQPSQL